MPRTERRSHHQATAEVSFFLQLQSFFNKASDVRHAGIGPPQRSKRALDKLAILAQRSQEQPMLVAESIVETLPLQLRSFDKIAD